MSERDTDVALAGGLGDHLDDVRAECAVDRLLEESWQGRRARANGRELAVEAAAALLFLAVALPLALPALRAHSFPLGLAAMLVGLYALVAGTVRFPLGAGNIVPTWVVLVPMLMLLPVRAVPLLVALGLLLAAAASFAARQARADQMLFAIPNGWHAFGPALVLLAFPGHHGAIATALVCVAAFAAGCLVDLLVSTLREAGALAIAPRLQFAVIAKVWALDACIAPIGLLLGQASRHDHSLLLIVAPLSGLLLMLERDRTKRIDEAHKRLKVVARERQRLQAAVSRLGDAFAATLELESLTSIALHGCVDALDADGGMLCFDGSGGRSFTQTCGEISVPAATDELVQRCARERSGLDCAIDGVHMTSVPFSVQLDGTFELEGSGAMVVTRAGRPFREDETAVMRGLVDRAQKAVREIFVHEALRAQAVTDPLTLLPNRRQLSIDLPWELGAVGRDGRDPLVLMLFDLDGFKIYNDTFGHLAGDALLARLGQKLAEAAMPAGRAYRLGGDEFCALLRVRPEELRRMLTRLIESLREQGKDFSVEASCGAVLLPQEASTQEQALQLADERMYAHKQRSRTGTREQTRNVLLKIMDARQPGLPDHSSVVAELAVAVGRRIGMNAEGIDELRRAAELHDVGKVGIPDAILDKPGPLDEQEWGFMRQHTVFGERILNAAPALRPVAQIVRASHERWDGRGYPDRLSGTAIPLAARIIAACDAYDAMTSDRCYRGAISVAAARDELIREAGRQFDPDVIAALLHELGDTGGAAEPNPGLPETLSQQYALEEAERLLGLLVSS